MSGLSIYQKESAPVSTLSTKTAQAQSQQGKSFTYVEPKALSFQEFTDASNTRVLQQMLSTAKNKMQEATLTYPSQSKLESISKSFATSKEAGVRQAYENMLSCARKCDDATKEFSQLDAHAFDTCVFSKQTNPSPHEEKAFKALQNYTGAQNDFAAAIAKFSATSKFSHLEFDALIQSAQHRVTEALNYAALASKNAQQKEAPQDLSKEDTALLANAASIKGEKMGDVLHEMSLSMHLNPQHIQALKADVDEYHNSINNLNANKGQLSKDEFKEKWCALSVGIAGIKIKIQELTAPKSGVRAEEALFQPLADELSEVEDRIDAFLSVDTRKNIINTVKSFLPHIEEKFSEMDFSLSAVSRNVLANAVHTYNQQAERLVNYISAPEVPEKCFKDAILKEVGYIKKNLQGPAIEEVVRKMKPKSPLRKALVPITFQGDNLRMVEKQHLVKMFELKDNENYKREDCLLMAVNHKINMEAVVEATVHNIPWEAYNIAATDSALQSTGKLGEGAANVVYACKYGGHDGINQDLVFKGEVSALRGYNGLKINKLGHNNSTSVAAVNIASFIAAQAIGCESVITKSSVGMLNGTFGLFMERAAGETPVDMCNKGVLLPDGTRKEFFEFFDDLEASQKEHFTANLMRELNKLEWADVLSGQGDRHAKNYLLDINHNDFSVKVTGIDNDASFSEAKIGMTKIDSTYIGEQKKLAFLRNFGIKGGSPIVETALFNTKQLEKLKEIMGFNQLFVPRFVDKDVYESLVSIDIAAYKNKLSTYLTPRATQAAILRLEEAIEHAKTLFAEGKYIENWTEAVNLEHEIHETDFKNGFMERDFYFLLPNAVNA